MSKTAIYYKVRDRLKQYVSPVIKPLLDKYYTGSSKSAQRKDLADSYAQQVQPPPQPQAPPRPKKV